MPLKENDTDAAPAQSGVGGVLRSQLELINRLHTALRATLRVEDLYEIVLATIVSEAGLGFDRAYLFLYDEREDVFRGAGAMGADCLERHREIRREIRQESRWLSQNTSIFTPEGEINVQEDAVSRGFEGLLSQAFWIDVIQKYPPSNPLDRLVRNVESNCRTCPGDQPGCLCRIAEGRQSMYMPFALDAYPPFLDGVIGRPAIGAPLRTKKGLRGILLADTAFSVVEEIPRAQRSLFEWFVTQVATALEHCELYSDLQEAYNGLKEIDTIKSSFLSTISHELRTPLTSITGFTDLLLSGRAGEPSDSHREFLARVHHHAMRLTDMVDDLLEIAESTSGAELALDLEPVDPLEELMQTIPRLEHRTRAKEVIIEPRIAGAVPRILANRAALGRVLFHLLDNAVKFTPAKGLVAVEFEPDDGKLRIHIQDTGIGISEENLKKIFSGFYQVDSRLARDYEGLGIGLTLTKKLLNAMGGAIDVQSRLGEGSRFSIEFRVARADGEKHGA
ncbi:MAG: HAMP domain-containing sensor histidine kinase [Candidatus Sumerlaeota bacterium]|nr:HAMP domain-containing sensor histidine kinase [Candidatus Sumerlaeota bacterium]